jgi:hypothetical protein
MHVKAIVAALLAANLATAAQAASDTPPNVRVRSISYAGAGCRAGSATAAVSPDGRSVVFLFDEFASEAGPGISPSGSRKNCQVNLSLDYPQGWQYALGAVDLRGTADLKRGATGYAAVRGYVSGNASLLVNASTTLRGPLQGEFRKHVAAPSALTWSPCQSRALNLAFEVRAANGNPALGSSLVTFGDFYTDWRRWDETQPMQAVELKWRRCTPPR